MRAMGSKSAAKTLMEKSGVPLLPGYHGERQDAALPRRPGEPHRLPADDQGGVRRRRPRHARRVARATNLPPHSTRARQEAASAFGDDRVLLERYLDHPRHIEVQVFADRHGNVVHLFERDCSVQRRHQKVIEEAPAPGLDDDRRAAMGRAAVAAAKAVGYEGAGTVEFVANADGFFFLEMNTRLQVEHPVTEMITGFDLVEWQLRVAAGEPLPVGTGRDPHRRPRDRGAYLRRGPGARLRAFHRAAGVVPHARAVSGHPHRYRLRHGRHGFGPLRRDARQADLPRRHARRRRCGPLRRALAATDVVGVASNLDLLGRIAAHPDFAAGGVDTGFIARHADTLLAPQRDPPIRSVGCRRAVCTGRRGRDGRDDSGASADPYSPWHARDHWWLNAVA